MDGGVGLGVGLSKIRTVEEVFKDFNARRNGLIKALTIDVEEFVQQCDPEKENLCLFGLPNGSWEVNLPDEMVPPELPEPTLGINFARDGMQEKDWLALVAVHSDAWLLSVAFYFCARFGFDKADRERLFNMVNDLPTLSEVARGATKKSVKDKSSITNQSGSKPESNNKMRLQCNVFMLSYRVMELVMDSLHNKVSQRIPRSNNQSFSFLDYKFKWFPHCTWRYCMLKHLHIIGNARLWNSGVIGKNHPR